MIDWEARVAAFWDAAGKLPEDEVLRQMDELLVERPADDPAALYERASAYDFVGREADAEPLYRQALAAGLDPVRRPQAIIQLASTLRNLGRAGEAVDLLTNADDRAECSNADDSADDRNADEGDEYADARTAFLALALIDAGRPAEGAARALLALSNHLTRYRRAVRHYAEEELARR